MNKRNTTILALLFVILIIEIIVIAPKELGISPSEDLKPGSAQVIRQGTPGSGLVMTNAHLVEANSLGKDREIWADRSIRSQNDDNLTLERVRATFFANNGVTYNVTGSRGQVAADKNDTRIEGDVETRSSNGYVFKTQSVFYDAKNRTLVSPEAVEMLGPEDEKGGRLMLVGSEMVSELNTNQITIKRNVRARKKVKNEKVVTIQSQRAVFSGRTNLAQFFGNVVIDIETMQLTGPEASFSYNPKTQMLDSMKVVGGIRVTDTDKFATSSAVTVHFLDDRVVFNGAPRVVQNGDELAGDEIVFLEGGRKVQVSNAKAQIDPKTMSRTREANK